MTSLPKQTLLAIDVVVIGGSLAGLACAIALRRVGHRVLILEKSDESEPAISGGCRLPPNMTKILFSWGLEKELRSKALTSETIQLSLSTDNTGEIVGTHRWEEEVLKETGGDYIFMHFADVQRILYNSAISHGAQIRHNSEVVSLDPDNRHVKLASGENVRGDVIIAADGPFSLARQDIVGKQNGDVEGAIGALTMYNAIVPNKEMKEDPDLNKLQENASLFVWLGHGRCMLGFPVGKEGDFAFHLYVPSEGLTGSWGESAPLPELRQATSPCEPILHKLAERASLTARMTVREYQPQDSSDAYDWVHDSGRMLIIGEAAHPYPAGSVQACAMAIEDGAVLAKLFSHLTHDDQVGSFLWAFQDLRQARCEGARQEEMGHLFYMTMPPGTMQEERDRELRSRYAAGLSALSGGEGGTADQWEGIKVIFGYDAEYEADNWWVQWGLLREWAKGRSTRDSGPGYIDLSSPN